MSNYFSYPWAVLYGLYFYILFQGMYVWRFGSINTHMSILTLYLVLVGIISVLMLMFFMQRLAHKKALMFVPFLLTLPFAYVGALGGGLLGAIGILFFGLAPFVIALPAGYWLIKKRFNQPSENVPASE